jgi:hypothetical protein
MNTSMNLLMNSYFGQYVNAPSAGLGPNVTMDAGLCAIITNYNNWRAAAVDLGLDVAAFPHYTFTINN